MIISNNVNSVHVDDRTAELVIFGDHAFHSRMDFPEGRCQREGNGANLLLPPANEVWGKVIFSEACVKNSVHRGEHVCGCGGMCVVAGGHAWLLGGVLGCQGGMHGCWGVCVAAGGMHGCWVGVHGCWGACIVTRGIHGCQGVCMVMGGVHGCGGHAWLGGFVWL